MTYQLAQVNVARLAAPLGEGPDLGPGGPGQAARGRDERLCDA
jgi:hypothetical protein